MLLRGVTRPDSCRFVTEVIREEEQSAASDLLRSQYQADRVAGLQMSVNPSAFSASPFYVPAFVFRSFHFGAKMHTFVSGTAHHLDAFLSCLRSLKSNVAWHPLAPPVIAPLALRARTVYCKQGDGQCSQCYSTRTRAAG